MSGDRSRSCETAGEEAQIGEVDPGGFAGDCCLKVFCEAAAAAKPGEAALHHPAPRQELEAFDTGGPLDNLDCPRPAIGNSVAQLLAAIDPVGKDMAQVRKAAAQV